jgi:hypothetical protein
LEVEDKQPRIVKSSERTPFRKSFRYGLYTIIGLILIVIIIIVLIVFKPKFENSHLSHKIQNLTTSYHSCNDGMKQLGSVVNFQFAHNTSYSRSVREKVLAYTSNCEFFEGHSSLAITYANQLESLYLEDGKSGDKNYLLWQHTIQFIRTDNQS